MSAFWTTFMLLFNLLFVYLCICVFVYLCVCVSVCLCSFWQSADVCSKIPVGFTLISLSWTIAINTPQWRGHTHQFGEEEHDIFWTKVVRVLVAVLPRKKKWSKWHEMSPTNFWALCFFRFFLGRHTNLGPSVDFSWEWVRWSLARILSQTDQCEG